MAIKNKNTRPPGCLTAVPLESQEGEGPQMNPLARRRTEPEPIERYEKSMCRPDNPPPIDWASLCSWTFIFVIGAVILLLAGIGFLDVCHFIWRHLHA